MPTNRAPIMMTKSMNRCVQVASAEKDCITHDGSRARGTASSMPSKSSIAASTACNRATPHLEAHNSTTVALRF